MLEFGTKFFSDERRYKKVNWKVNVRDHIITKFDCTVRFTRLSPKGITQKVLLKTVQSLKIYHKDERADE